jgi:two-component system cell cycle response regulator
MACVPPPNDDVGEKTVQIKGDPTTLMMERERAAKTPDTLLIVRGTPQGHRFHLLDPEITIGRDDVCTITINDSNVSRKHAKVLKMENRVLIEDMGSSNGTFINDKKLVKGERRELQSEDMIKLGSTILKFLPSGHIEIVYMGELGDSANKDAMTQAFNKAYLLQALEAEFKRAKALQTDFSIIFMDLDHFKKVNDTFGHDAGDQVLKTYAQLVRTHHLRPKDIFARYGGEEFILLLSRTNGQKAAETAEKIRQTVESHSFLHDGKRIPVTTSLGVAEMTSTIESAQTLLKKADESLYQAKQQGRNRVVVAT